MTLLQEGKEESVQEGETGTTTTELEEAYRSYLEAYSKYQIAEETSKRHGELFKNLRSCIAEFGKIPFIGKRILKEMEEISMKKTDGEER